MELNINLIQKQDKNKITENSSPIGGVSYPTMLKSSKLREGGMFPFNQIDSDDYLYKPLGTNKILDRKNTAIDQANMIENAWGLYNSNPLAHNIIELFKGYIVGDGITFKAKDARVQKRLDDFWKRNQMTVRQYEFAGEFVGLYGELVLPVDVNEKNGMVTIGYIDPKQIHKVEPSAKNVLQLEKIKIKPAAGLSVEEKDYKSLNIINYDNITEKLQGEVFFFKTNSVSNSTRGCSILLSVMDYIAAYDDFLFNELERIRLLLAMVWDVTLENADEKMIRDFLTNDSPKLITPNTVYAHNQSVKIEPKTPNIQSGNLLEGANLFKGHILDGVGLLERSNFQGKQSGYISDETSEPVLKRLTITQNVFKYSIEYILQFVIDSTPKEIIPPDADKSFSVHMFDLTQKDTNRIAKALTNMGTMTKNLSELYGNSDGVKKLVLEIIKSLVSQLGVTVDVEEILQSGANVPAPQKKEK